MDKNTALSTYLEMDSVKKSIKNVLGSKAQQFVTSMIAVVNSNTKLQEADKKSIINACMTAAALDLPINPNLGFAYIIPYNDKNSGLVAQFQIGYKGIIQLALRSKEYKTINVTDVRQGEYSGINRLSGEYSFNWIEDQKEREKLPIIGYVAYFSLHSGFSKALYMTAEELKKHAMKYSKTMKKGYGNWVDDFDSMAKKTPLKLLVS